MNIQRFNAPTAREALALARAAFGDATLILSNRQMPNGVEVMAAAEGMLSDLEWAPELPVPAAPRDSAPVRPAPVAQAVAAPAAPRPVPTAADMANSREVVNADTEQMAMSTLSFQDYVRERMLRRQQEARGPLPEPVQRPAAPAPQPQPRPESAVPPSIRAAAPVLPSAPVAQPVPSVPAWAALPVVGHVVEHLVDIDIEIEEAAPQPRLQEPAGGNAGVMAQLDAMKQMMEDRFNTLSWLGQARQDPIQSNLMLKLVRAGYSPALARSVLESMPGGLDATDAVRWLMAALTSRVSVATEPMHEAGGVFALIGATGVGKTTTAAKLAGLCARMHGAASVGLVTLDTQRAGAHEQLRAFGRSLGVVAHLAHDRAALHELLALLGGKKMVIVDTPGIAPRDPRRRELLDMLAMPQVQRVLVLNAGAHGDTLDEIAAAFKLGGTQQAIVSKTDEAAKLGPVLDTLARHEFVLRGIANGQRVPEDWKTADADALVRESMRAAQRSPFDPRSNDVDFFFSPAASAA